MKKSARMFWNRTRDIFANGTNISTHVCMSKPCFHCRWCISSFAIQRQLVLSCTHGGNDQYWGKLDITNKGGQFDKNHQQIHGPVQISQISSSLHLWSILRKKLAGGSRLCLHHQTQILSPIKVHKWSLSASSSLVHCCTLSLSAIWTSWQRQQNTMKMSILMMFWNIWAINKVLYLLYERERDLLWSLFL